MATTVISSIQFKRGLKENLIAKLTSTALGVLKDGEPCWELDTNKIKIGDGKSDYADLPYLTGSSDTQFVITDPIDSQVILYDATTKQWVNKSLADDEAIIYLKDSGLTLKGYEEASQGQMLVKDATKGLAWVNPTSTQELQQYVSQAQTAASQANNYSSAAGTSATEAATSATTAQTINAKTMEWFNEKFWWGTLSEYNELTSINKDTFYFITAEE